MALRRSQWNAKKSSVELEPIVPESEPIMIYMEEVEVQEETKDDKERHLSEKNKTIDPNIWKQQKWQKYQQASSDYHTVDPQKEEKGPCSKEIDENITDYQKYNCEREENTKD